MAETVTRAIFEAETRGVDKAAAALGGLSGAAAGAGKAVEDFTRTTNETATEIAGIERRVDGLQKRLAGAPAAWSRYEAAMRAANDGQKAGILTGEKYASTVREIQAELQRVVAPRLDMDAANSGLTALLGNTQKVTAATRAQAREMLQMAQAQQTADAEAARGRELMARETARYAAEIDDLRAKFDPAHASARRMGAELEDLARLEREGIAIHGGYEAALQGVIEKYDDTAAAARKAADAQRAMIQQARRDQDNANAQTRFSSSASYGVAGLGGNWLSRQNPTTGSTAREAASVFEAEAKAVETLRAAIDPLAAAQAKLNSEVAEYQALAARGVITNDELALATSKANEGYQVLATKLGAVGTQAKITQQQMLNLSRQANDVLTMGFMGMPLSMIVTSQLGQIYGALEENQRGVRGSIEAITNSVKNFASGLGPVGIALGALGVAAATFALVTRRDVEPLEDVIKGQADAVRDLRDAYGLAGDAAESYARRAPNAVRRRAEGTTDDSLARAEQEIRDRIVDQYAGSFNRLNEMRFEGAAELRAAFDDLFQSIGDGVPRFIEFQEQLALIPDADVPYFIRDAIKANDDWAKSFVPLQQEIEGTQSALNGIALAAQNYRKAMGDLAALTPDLRTNAERINAALSTALSNAGEDQGAGLVARFRAEQAMAADTANALDVYVQARADLAAVGLGDDARAIAEINAQYDALEDQYLGNADALNVLVDARRAAIEAVNAQSAFDAGEKARQEAEEYAKALSELARGIDDQVASLQRQVDLFGQSEGATAAVETRTRMLADAYALARENNEVVSPEQIAQIEASAAAVGYLTDQLVAMREAAAQAERVADTIADLEFQNSLFGMSDADREIATTLRQLQVSYESMDGQRIAGAVRYRAEQERVQEQLETQNKFVENVLSTSLDALFNVGKAESWGDAVLGIFADIGRQFQELAKQNLMQALFGQNYTTGQLAPGQRSIAQPGFPDGFSGAPVAANQNVAAPGALNVRAVNALNDNLQRSSRSALDVARQFDGLNERADSAVLDSFMQASGNWNNLSAADTAWCAAFANAAITQAGGRGTGSNLASSFMGWGQGTNTPQVGDIVVLKPQARGASGHVGFVAGFGDGTVQVFGGNQSNAANTRSFGLDQVRGYRTGVGVGGDGVGGSFAMPQMPAYAPPQMSLAAQQAMAGGWSGFGPVPGQSGSSTVGMFGQNGRISQIMQSPLGQMGMMGLGAFGAGYSSGSAGSGALQGGLTGFLTGGPIGGLVGLAGGLLGGLFGGRQKRKQEHQQRAEAWAAQAQEWAAYQDEVRTGVGPTSGLRASQEAMANRLTGFVQTGSAAWKMGSNNSSALFSQVGAELAEYFARTNAEFGRAYEAQIASLNAGQGLSGPFISARDEILEAGKTLATFVDDTRVVFGDGSVEAQRAAEASIAQLRALLTGGQELSDIAAAVEQMRGAAAGLHTQLEVLGKSAEEAGQIVRDDLTTAMDRLRSDFTRGIQDQINDLDGKGYLADFRALVEGVQQTMQDAARLGGVDTSLVDTFFAKSAQNLVNQAQLTGEAFDDLVRIFPQLSGIVKAFSEAVVTATEAEIRSAIEGYENRLFAAQNGGNDLVAFERQAARERVEAAKFGADAVAALEKTLAAERANIVVAGARADLDQAWREHQDAVNERIRALRDEASELERTVSRLTSFVDSIKELQDSIRLDQNLTTLGGMDLVNEAQRQYEETYRKAMAGDEDAMGQLAGSASDYLSAARDYFAATPEYAAIFDDVNRQLDLARRTAGDQLSEAQRQLNAIEKQITLEEEGLALAQKQYEALLGINHSVLSLGTAMAAFATAMAAARAVGVDVGPGGGATTPTDASFGRGVDYLNANPDVAAGIAAGQTFGLAPGSSLEAIAKAHWERHGQYEDPTKRKGYALGGYVTGAGTGTSDSIAAWLSNGEHVTRAMSVNRETRPVLDHVNLTGRLPPVPAVQSPSAASRGHAIVEELRHLRRENKENAKALADLQAALADADRRERREQTAEVERRRESSSRIASRRSSLAA